MRAEAFEFREFFHRLQRLLKRRAAVFHNARAALELIHRQPGERRARAVGRQNVARPGDVIAQHRRRIISQKNRARRQDFFGNFLRLARHHFAMFRRKLVRQRNRIVQMFHQNQPAIVLQRARNGAFRASFGNIAF